MHCGVAEQDGLLFAGQQRFRHVHGRVGGGAGKRRFDTVFGGNGGRQIGQRTRPVRGRCHQRIGHRHGPVGPDRIDAGYHTPFPCRLPDSLREQRMVLAQVGADHKHGLQTGQRCDRAAQMAHALGRRELGVAQTMIDVFAAERAHQRRGQVQLLQCAVRAHQRADRLRAVRFNGLAQAIGHVFERGLPVDFQPLAALLQHRLGEALFGIQGFIRKTIAVGQPALVDCFVFERQHAHHLVVLDLHDQVRTGRVVRADRLAPRQLPVARLKAEWLAGDRADRAQVDHVARQFGVHRIAEHRGDLRMFAAVDHAELHHPADFLAEADAARAVDAARHLLHRQERADVLVKHHALFFFVARG